MVNQLSSTLSASLSGFIGEACNESTLEKVKSSLLDSVGQAGSKTTAYVAWSRMSTLDKMKWFLIYRMVTSIGVAIQDAYRGSCVSNRPLWSYSNPHVVVVADMYFAQPLPIRNISLSLSSAESLTETIA